MRWQFTRIGMPPFRQGIADGDCLTLRLGPTTGITLGLLSGNLPIKRWLTPSDGSCLVSRYEAVSLAVHELIVLVL